MSLDVGTERAATESGSLQRTLQLPLSERFSQALKELNTTIEALERRESILRCIAPALRNDEELQQIFQLQPGHPQRKLFENQLNCSAASISTFADGAAPGDHFTTLAWRFADCSCKAREASEADQTQNAVAHLNAAYAIAGEMLTAVKQ